MLRKLFATLMLLCILISIVYASDGENFLSIKSVTIRSSGADLNIYMEYQLSIFSRLYLLLFGGKSIEPKLLSSLHGFGELSVTDLRDYGANLTAKNSVKESGGYYLFYGGKIDQTVSLIIELPHSTIKRYENTREIPPFFYK